MGYYERNLRYLEQFSPALYQTVTASPLEHPAETIYLSEASNILVKNSYAECYLHSIYDQEREMARMFDGVNDDVQVIVLFGLGMGFIIPYIAEKFPLLDRLIVIEPNLDTFRVFLDRQDLSAAFQAFHKVSFVINQPEAATTALIESLIVAERYSRIEVVAAIPYQTLYRDYYQAVKRIIVDKVRILAVNLATKFHLAQRWLVNTWRNRRHHSIELGYLLAHTPKWPVIIVSAGPSLNNNIHLLPKAKEKALIIAVGSAISILGSNGIVPHFRMSCDGSEKQLKVFSNVDTTECPLIYSETLYHEVLSGYQGKTVEMVTSTDLLAPFFYKKQDKTTKVISSGFSVANIAFDLVCKWGCPQVILMGQDLCYTDKRLHATGSWDDQKPNQTVNEQVMPKVKDIHGNDVYTDAPFLGMKKLFEVIAPRYPHIQFWNASEGGLPISGIPNKSLQQILDEDLHEKLDVTETITQILDEYQYTAAMKETDKRIAQAIDEELLSIQVLLQECITELTQIADTEKDPMLLQKNTHKLKKIENKIKKIENKDFFRHALLDYIEDSLQIAKARAEYHGNDPAVRMKKTHQKLSTEVTLIAEIIGWTQPLVKEYKGEKILNIIY